MEDLVQSQIQQGCHLAMPEGLKDLMSDISREVLRAQPDDLYQFITNYLAALLDAREALFIASRACGEACNCSCHPELDHELQCIGLSDEDVAKAKEIVQEHFNRGRVEESSLLIQLTKKLNVNESQLNDLCQAIQRAFQRHLLKRKRMQVSFANASDEDYDDDNEDESDDKTETTHESGDSSHTSSDFYKPETLKEDNTSVDVQDQESLCKYPSYIPCVATESAATLAGSYVNLPKIIPYSVHNSISAIEPYASDFVTTVFYNENIQNEVDQDLEIRSEIIKVFDDMSRENSIYSAQLSERRKKTKRLCALETLQDLDDSASDK